jgi:hypothetical protein
MINDRMIKKKYDLEERTAKFGEEIVKFAKKFLKILSPNPLLASWLEQEQALARITAKQTMQNQEKIFNTK